MSDDALEQSRDFFRAAASFYRKSPWRAVGEEETIRVECEQLDHGPWYAIVLGKTSKLRGLMLCDDRESRLLLAHGEYEAIAGRLRNITVHYRSRKGLDPGDLEWAQRHGFEVASSRAYPAVFRLERGRRYRPPVAWELEVLEACLWILPDFLKRAGDRSPEVLEYAFTGTIGTMTWNLSWVPVERPRSDRPR